MATSAASPNDLSFTAMDKGDVDAVGKHCAFCRQLDFLPFKCYSCGDTFCDEHKTESGHLCKRAGEFAKRRKENANAYAANSAALASKPTANNTPTCAKPDCSVYLDEIRNLGIHCENCNRRYCVQHRLQSKHDCKNLPPLGARPMDLVIQSNKEKLKAGFGKLRTWGKEKQLELKPKPKSTSLAARLAEVNKMKQTAVGDSKIPQEKRMYLRVTGTPRDSTVKPPEKNIYCNADWNVGRLLDYATQKLQIENINNTTQKDGEVLHIYHVESNDVLPFGEKVSQRLADGNHIYVLRGIGPKRET